MKHLPTWQGAVTLQTRAFVSSGDASALFHVFRCLLLNPLVFFWKGLAQGLFVEGVVEKYQLE